MLQPPPEMTLSQWADKFRRLSAGSSAEPGRWKTAKAPYQKEIMDAITDITIKKVVIMSAAQVGKTDAMVLNPIGYYVHYDPSPIMVIQPTIDMAEKFSKEKLSPMLRDTPVLADRINEKSRNSGNTIMQKIFPGGFITIAGANSPTGLRSHTIRILLADEIDAYPASAGKEGDPLLLASKRQTTFWNKKQVDISTPTVKGASRIEVEYENSSRGEWNAPCPCCGELQPLVWSNVVFDKNDLSEIRYACSKCGVISSEAEWKEHFIDGTFVHEDPDNPVRGFHLNTLASTLTTWQEVVEKFLTANDQMKKGNVELMKVWTNTEMGQTWEEDGETIEDDELMKRREKYKCEVPEEVLYLTAGVAGALLCCLSFLPLLPAAVPAVGGIVILSRCNTSASFSPSLFLLKVFALVSAALACLLASLALFSSLLVLGVFCCCHLPFDCFVVYVVNLFLQDFQHFNFTVLESECHTGVILSTCPVFLELPKIISVSIRCLWVVLFGFIYAQHNFFVVLVVPVVKVPAFVVVPVPL